MQILVTSDGPDTLERAAEYTSLFADPADTQITLMGQPSEEHLQFESLHESFTEEMDSPVKTRVRRGDTVEQTLKETQQHTYDLVVLGIHLRRRWGHLRPKFVARHVVNRIQVPLLIVFPEWDRLRRVLVCTGAGRKESSVLRAAAKLARLAEAEVTVLHVMSQIPLSADSQVEDLERDADELIEHDTREGAHLAQTLKVLERLGLPAEKLRAKVRRGLVVDEIVRESEEGNFDLVVVGAHHVPSERSWHELRELIQENIAERVLMEARRPVLIVPPTSEKQNPDYEKFVKEYPG
jgi:nucleotide-binding universal stress UspA family protein